MTDFEKRVLRAVMEIPAGEVRSYKDIAKQVGRPRAYRAVANALNKNPFPLLVPCHRVIRANREIGGYAWGGDLKRSLLNLERKISAEIK